MSRKRKEPSVEFDTHVISSIEAHLSPVVNSVAQIFNTAAMFEPTAPFHPPPVKDFSGSGFVIEQQGDTVYLMTNAHVVENAIELRVRFPQTGEVMHKSKLVGFCMSRDVAIVSVQAASLTGMKIFKFANSLETNQGDEVHAIGYPLGERLVNMTKGVISGRSLQEDGRLHFGPLSYLQITAPINPGNSGGPVINGKGEVVGVAAAAIMFASNIGYAIPSNTVQAILQHLRTTLLCKVGHLGLSVNRGPTGSVINYIQPISCFFDRAFDDDKETRRELTLDHAGLNGDDKWTDIKRGDVLAAVDITSAGMAMHFEFDAYGTTRLDGFAHIFKLGDVEEMIDYGSPVTLTLKSDKQTRKLTRPFVEKPIDDWMLRPFTGTLEPHRLRFLLVGGVVFVENVPGVIDGAARPNPYIKNIIIASILGGGLLDNYGLKAGNRLIKVDQAVVFGLEQLGTLLSKSSKVMFTFKQHFLITLDTAAARQADAVLKESFQVTDKNEIKW